MGLNDFVAEVTPVFEFLIGVWSAFPNAIKLLIYMAFGGVLFLALLRSFWR